MLARCFSLSIALGLLGCTTLQPMAGSSPELRQQIAAGQLLSPGDRLVITTADGQRHRLVAVAADSAIVRGKHDSVPTNQIDFVQKSVFTAVKTTCETAPEADGGCRLYLRQQSNFTASGCVGAYYGLVTWKMQRCTSVCKSLRPCPGDSSCQA